YDGAPSALDALQSLCDKSLLVRYAPAELPEEHRFSMLLSVREYARRRLEEGGAAAARARHPRDFLRVGGAWCERIHGPGGLEARARLALEEENLLAVHRRALEAEPRSPDGLSHALGAALALHPVLTAQGLYRMLVSLFDVVLDVA